MFGKKSRKSRTGKLSPNENPPPKQFSGAFLLKWENVLADKSVQDEKLFPAKINNLGLAQDSLCLYKRATAANHDC